MNELREHRLAVASGDDVLQLHSTMWYAWVSLNQHRSVAPACCQRPFIPSDPNFDAGTTQDEPCDLQDSCHLGVDDSLLAMMVESRPSTPPSISMDVSPDHATDSAGAVVIAPIAGPKKPNRRLKNQAKKESKWRASSSQQPGCEFACPLCQSNTQRRFHKGGLFCHLWVLA